MSGTSRTRRALPWSIAAGCLLAGGVVLVGTSSLTVQTRPPLPAGRAIQVVLTTAAKAGSLDPTFGQKGVVVSDAVHDEYAEAMTVQADHKILVAGYQEGVSPGNIPHFILKRFDASGKPDLSFGTGGQVVTAVRQASISDQAFAVAVQPDGKILVAGLVFNRSYHSDFALVRYTPAGTLDASFGTQGRVITTVGNGYALSGAHAVAVQPDGKILVTGIAPSDRKVSRVALLRYTASGSLDPAFGDHGVTTTAVGSGATNDAANTIMLLKDGRILVAGSTRSASSPSGFALLRFLASGKLDPSFGKQGKVVTVVGRSDGDHAASAKGMTVLADGGILLAGDANVTKDGEAQLNIGLVKYHADGSLDPSFGTKGTTVTTGPYGLGFQSLAALPDSRFLIIGNVFTSDSTNDYAFIRYSRDGSLDSTYGQDKGGLASLESADGLLQISSLYVQPDGKIVIAGMADFKGTSHFVLSRFNP